MPMIDSVLSMLALPLVSQRGPKALYHSRTDHCR